MKAIVKIREERCKGCGLCVSVCPQKILVYRDGLNQKGYRPIEISHMDRCVGCASCGLMCPDGVIRVDQAEEDRDE